MKNTEVFLWKEGKQINVNFITGVSESDDILKQKSGVASAIVDGKFKRLWLCRSKYWNSVWAERRQPGKCPGIKESR